ncbi:MAG: hypothetical protein AAGC95_10885 [Pseudomonadota bacterium]
MTTRRGFMAGASCLAVGLTSIAGRSVAETFDFSVLSRESAVSPFAEHCRRAVVTRGAPDMVDVRRVLKARLAGVDETALPIAVAEAVEDDYRTNRVLKVDGWLLSETEVYLAALAAEEAASDPSAWA